MTETTNLTVKIDHSEHTWEILDANDIPMARGHFEDEGSLTVIDKSAFERDELPLLLIEAMVNGEI